jgi:hypothetical protein
VQGVVDAVMSLSGAAGGVAAGLILAASSYAVLGDTATVLMLLVLEVVPALVEVEVAVPRLSPAVR